MKRLAGITVMAIVLAFCTMAFGQAASSGTTAASTNSTAQSRNLSEPALQRITQEVRHQLVMLPYYSVFDNLSYKVSPDGTVTLMGQVLDPTLKPDAERAVKKVEGVEKVVNNIEVLPTSPNDDRIRRAVYRAIYGNDVLAPYSLRAVPPIHIIVKNGNVTLTGVVARQMDKQAKSVPGVFGVTDDLQVENTKG
jgi:hyperosmotically inducible protein